MAWIAAPPPRAPNESLEFNCFVRVDAVISYRTKKWKTHRPHAILQNRRSENAYAFVRAEIEWHPK
eukprot:99074-Pelagomonas_calceolata.AAC.1